MMHIQGQVWQVNLPLYINVDNSYNISVQLASRTKIVGGVFMRTYREHGEEYKFNREAFRQFVEPLHGRSKDGKSSLHALFVEWEPKLGVSLDTLKHWYYDTPYAPISLDYIKKLGNVLNIDYHLLLTKLKKEGIQTDMNMKKILEQNERIESKIDSIMECNTNYTGDINYSIPNDLSVIEEAFAKMVDYIYDMQAAWKQCDYNKDDLDYIQKVHQEAGQLHRFIDCKAFTLSNSHRYQLHRMVIDLDLFFCEKAPCENPGVLGDRLPYLEFSEGFDREIQIRAFTTTQIEGEIVLAERLGFDEEDIVYLEKNAYYDVEDLMEMGFRERNSAFELDGFIVMTDYMVCALKEAFMDVFGNIMENDTNA